jgi:hypothetical protein
MNNETDVRQVMERTTTEDSAKIQEPERATGDGDAIDAEVLSLRSQLSTLTQERDQWRHRADLLSRERIGEVWVWQGDDEDHPESLACPVLMRPEHVRKFITERDALVKALKLVNERYYFADAERDVVVEALALVDQGASK